MKKTLKSELVSIAHKILQTKDDATYAQLAARAQELSQKLGLLALVQRIEDGAQPTIGIAALEEKLSKVDIDTLEEVVDEDTLSRKRTQKTQTPDERTPLDEHDLEPQLVVEDDDDNHRPDGTQIAEDQDDIHEPVIEKIKDIVAAMPPEADAIEKLVDAIEPADRYMKNDVFEIGGEYAQTLIFEPVETKKPEEHQAPTTPDDVQNETSGEEHTASETIETPRKNVNSSVKKGYKVGLNDRIAFVNQLFEGSDADYNRVLSQVATLRSYEAAKSFIETMVKPEYNWEGKEVIEARFMTLIENNY